MSQEEAKETAAKEITNSYVFIGDDASVRCFIFECIVTYCEKVIPIADLDAIFQWVRHGTADRPASKKGNHLRPVE